MSKTHFCTFGCNRFEYSKFRLEKEAMKSNWFDHIHIYGKNHLSFVLKTRNFDGFAAGWFWWKSETLRLALGNMDYGDILIWLDAGFVINSNDYGYKKYLEYKDIIDNNESGMLFVSNGSEDVNGEYIGEERCTKRDVLLALDCDYPEFYKSPQIASGTIMMKKTDLAVEIVNDWCYLSETIKFLDDTPSYNPEHTYYENHKNDQSVLSLIVKKKFKEKNIKLDMCEYDFYDKSRTYQYGQDIQLINSYYKDNQDADFNLLRFPFLAARVNDFDILNKFLINYRHLS